MVAEGIADGVDGAVDVAEPVAQLPELLGHAAASAEGGHQHHDVVRRPCDDERQQDGAERARRLTLTDQRGAAQLAEGFALFGRRRHQEGCGLRADGREGATRPVGNRTVLGCRGTLHLFSITHSNQRHLHTTEVLLVAVPANGIQAAVAATSVAALVLVGGGPSVPLSCTPLTLQAVQDGEPAAQHMAFPAKASWL